MRLIVNYQDDFGAAYDLTSNIVKINEPDLGILSIIVPGGVLTNNIEVLAYTNDVFDLNGGSFTQFNWALAELTSTIVLGTNQIQKLSPAHVAQLINTQSTLILQGVFRDALGFETTYSATRAGNSFGIGDFPTQGVVRIDGSPYFTAGAQFTANITDLSDLNGLGIFSYQWEKSLANGQNWTPLAQATLATYALVKSEFSAIAGGTAPQLRVAVTHMDLLGNIVTKYATQTHQDRPGNGYVAIDNVLPQPGEAVTVFFTPTDPDGVKTLDYTWQHGYGTEFRAVPGAANAARYTIQAADFAPDTSVRLIAVLHDDYNNGLTVTSNVVRLASRVRGSLQLTLLSEVLTDPLYFAALTTEIFDLNGGALTAATWSMGPEIVRTAALGTNSPGLTLAGPYVALFAAGLPVQLEATHVDALGFTTTLTAQIINTLQAADQPTEGALRITGPESFRDNANYVVDTSALTDRNGLGTFTYQWYKSLDGQSFANLPGQTNARYILRSRDYLNSTAPELAVEVVHHDRAGFQQTLFTSQAHRDTPPSALTLRSTGIRPGAVVALETPVQDPNGLKTVRYQWEFGRDAFTNPDTPAAETAATYTIKMTHFAPADSARLRVITEDYFGGGATLTSERLLINSPTNAPFWLEIDGGLIDQGVEIRAITTAVVDGNGGNFTEFSWNLASLTLTATGALYTLTAPDAQRMLRGEALHVTAVYQDQLGFATTVSAAINIQLAPPTGAVQIRGPVLYQEGNRYTADISAVAEQVGLGEFEYQWGYVVNELTLVTVNGLQVINTLEGNFHSLQNQTLAVYAMAAANFNAGQKLMVMVMHRDVLGIVTPFAAKLPNQDQPAHGALTLALTNYVMGRGVVTVQHQLQDKNGINRIHWEWQTGQGPDFSQPIKVLTTEINAYTLTPGHFNPHDHLAAVALVYDNFNSVTRLTTAPVQINQPATGEVKIIAPPANIQQFSGDTSAVTDNNGPVTAVNELWQDPAGRVLGRGPNYQPATAGLNDINYLVVVQDPAGFRTTLASNFNIPAADQAVEDILPGLDLETARKFNQAVWRHLDRRARAAATPVPELALNHIQISAAAQLSQLANVTRVTSAYAEAPAAADYAFWSDAFWTETTGELVSLNYQGTHQGWLTGVDYQQGSVKWGVAAGQDDYKLKVDWTGSGQYTGRLNKKMKVLLPYLEFRTGPNTFWRTIAGYGTGDLEFLENTVRSRAQFDWYMFGTDLKALQQINHSWDIKFGLGGYVAKTKTGKIKSGAETRAGLNNSFAGESSANLETGYKFHLADSGYIRPFFNFGWRAKYGVVKDLMIFDGAVGVDFLSHVYGLNGNFTWSDQLSANKLATQTQFNGALGINLSERQSVNFSSNYDATAPWTNKLSWGYLNETSKQLRVNTQLYFQHNPGWTVGTKITGEFVPAHATDAPRPARPFR